MIKWASRLSGTEVSLGVITHKDVAIPAIEGINSDAIKKHLSDALGPYGHRLDEAVSGFYLDHALRSEHGMLAPYSFIVVSGHLLIKPPTRLPIEYVD